MFFALAIPRSITHARCAMPKRGSMLWTMCWIVLTSRVIAREDLIAQRHALVRNHQRDVYLHAVEPMIMQVAASRDVRIRGGFEIRARHVIEQQIVIELEELTQTLPESKRVGSMHAGVSRRSDDALPSLPRSAKGAR